MSIALNKLAQSVTWQGQIYSLPISLCPGLKPAAREMRIDIPWTVAPYSGGNSKRSVAVKVNITGQKVAAPLDCVRFVKIDNSFNDSPVYLQFPDSQDAITCPANSIVGTQVMTNILDFSIFCTKLFDGRSPITSVFLSNAPQEPYYIPGASEYDVEGSLTDISAFGISAGVNTVNMKFGAAYADRTLALIIGGERTAGTGTPITALTVAGTAVVPFMNYSPAIAQFLVMAALFLPIGTTGNVSITSSAALNGMFCGIYAFSGATTAVPLNTDNDVDNTFLNPVVSGQGIPGGFQLSACVSGGSLAPSLINNDMNFVVSLGNTATAMSIAAKKDDAFTATAAVWTGGYIAGEATFI